MDLLVFGANGPTGRLVVTQALARGHTVGAVTRRPAEYPLRSPRLQVIDADVTDSRAVDRAMSSRPHAVISTYGVPYSRRPITVYSHGIANLLASMTAHQVTRLVCVTSTTIAAGDAPHDPLLWRRVVVPLLRHVVGRTLYDDMERMEELVRNSEHNWTIVRPAGLFDSQRPSDDYEVANHRLAGRVTSRADLAETLIDEATHDRHPRSTIEVLTRSGTPTFASFVREVRGST